MRTLIVFVSLAALFVSGALAATHRPCFSHNCVFQETGDKCKEYKPELFKRMPLSQDEQDAIVKWHNDRRREIATGLVQRGPNGKHQPKAANMMKMYWDEDMAILAQRLADQCLHLTHDCYKCREDPLARFPRTGQNLYWKWEWPGRQSFASGYEIWWFNEVDLFDPALIPNYKHSWNIAHYSQLAWWNTRAVGCGRVIHGMNATWSEHLMVCDYGPWGNVETQPMYKIGEPGSQCPAKTSNVDGLCAFPEDFDPYQPYPSDGINQPARRNPDITLAVV